MIGIPSAKKIYSAHGTGLAFILRRLTKASANFGEVESLLKRRYLAKVDSIGMESFRT